MSKTKNSKIRMYSRAGIHVPSKNSKEEYSIKALFDMFLTDKSIEGLSKRTLHDYYVHFDYLVGFLREEITNNQFSKEIFKSYIAYMLLHERGLSPVTANVRIRTIRAFLRYCYLNGYFDEPIHEHFKPVKTKEDTLESFTPDEIKKLLSVVDDKSYKGFRDKVIIYLLLDTLVRCSELKEKYRIKSRIYYIRIRRNKNKKGENCSNIDTNNKTVKRVYSYYRGIWI